MDNNDGWEIVRDPSEIARFKAAPGDDWEIVTDEHTIRQFQGIAPVGNTAQVEADTDAFLARARQQAAGTYKPPEQPLQPGNPFSRVVVRGAEAAKDAFTDGGELGVDNAGNLVVKAGSAAADAIIRGIGAVVRGGAAVAGATAEELGASQGMAKRLERDLNLWAESTAGGATPAASTRRFASKAVGNKAAAPLTETDKALQAAQRLGVDVPKAAVAGPVMKPVLGTVADTPIIGAPIQNAARKATNSLENVVREITDELGGATLQGAGDTVKDAMLDWVKVGSKERAAEIFAPVEQMMKETKAPKRGPLTRTDVALRELEKRATESGLKPPAIVATMKGAVQAAEDAGGFTFQGMQRLRTEIGDRISGNISPEPGQSMSALKSIYASLTDDIEFVIARVGGKDGVKKWRDANDLFKNDVVARRKAITKIVGTDGNASAETVGQRILTMLSDKRGADLERILDARTTLGKAAWDNLASAVLGRMGQTKDGFSLARWRTEYNNLSPEGRKLLFDDDHRAALDDLFSVAQRFEELAKLGNPSGSGRMVTSIGGLSLGYFVSPTALLGAMLPSASLSLLYSRPAAVRAAADWSTAYANLAGKAPTERAYEAAKGAALRMRDVFDREGIEVISHASIAAQPAMRQSEGTTP